MNLENSKGTLESLLLQVQEQNNRSADFLASTDNLQKRTNYDEGKPQIVIEATGGEPTRILDINEHAFGQIAQNVDIDTRTARRLQEKVPHEFDGVVNALWQKQPNKRMVRTFLDTDETTGTVRAFVSDKFKTFDNINLLSASLPQLRDSDAQWKVVNGTITDKRLYLRLKSEVQTGSPAVGDEMANGIGLSNSEVGAGSVSVYQTIWTLACLNGMQTENRNRSSHITSARDSADYGLLSGEAKDADNKALELKLRDLVKAYASRETFDEILEKMNSAHGDIIEGEFNEIPERVGTVLKLTKKENTDVLNGLIATMGQSGYNTGKVTRATMVNAVTAVANNCHPDDADLWQQRGGKLLHLNDRDWNRIAA
ncbi:MAG: hypothetical protein CL833_08980 [Crocinitomicaceae bacterium]|nr:hypothetical protein [Crocinitomicaceae bacterium]